MRTFETGATRDDDEGKPDYEGFISPLVIQRYGEYMLKHQVQADGITRPSDNWQNGIPKDTYIKSGLRHMIDWWNEHRGNESRDGVQEALCALLFNASGYLHELLKDEQIGDMPEGVPCAQCQYEDDGEVCDSCKFGRISCFKPIVPSQERIAPYVVDEPTCETCRWYNSCEVIVASRKCWTPKLPSGIVW
jgi:hypothetical protein